ncbi:MAG TPA: hypothetical protein VI685_26650 [Candidatus Angelobacter sp.]
MKIKILISAIFLVLALGALVAVAKTGVKDKDAPAATTPANAAQDDPMRLQGEKAFHSNCSRCHAAPPKFSPRLTATIIRHMRVRATITDQEMRVILHYMTQ